MLFLCGNLKKKNIVLIEAAANSGASTVASCLYPMSDRHALLGNKSCRPTIECSDSPKLLRNYCPSCAIQ